MDCFINLFLYTLNPSPYFLILWNHVIHISHSHMSSIYIVTCFLFLSTNLFLHACTACFNIIDSVFKDTYCFFFYDESCFLMYLIFNDLFDMLWLTLQSDDCRVFYQFLSLSEVFSVTLTQLIFSWWISDSNEMLVLQSEGSTPKVHEGDGRLCWLHVLPYEWVWLMPQRAGSIWEEMFFGMKSCTLLLFKIISQAI